MFRSSQSGSWADDDADASASQDARGGRFDRPNEGGRGRFDRPNEGGSGRFDRSNEGGSSRFDRSDEGRGGRADRTEGGRWERNAAPPPRSGGGRDYDSYGRDGGSERDRRDQQRGPPMPVERGFVVSMRENFGFVSCADREGDLFFHVTEAPVDVQLGDEVEFRVKFNQRSQKDLAVQLVTLPKGTIVMEDVRVSSLTILVLCPSRSHSVSSLFSGVRRVVRWRRDQGAASWRLWLILQRLAEGGAPWND
jgi:cold shock CspA family protein